MTRRRLSASDLPGLVSYRSVPEVARYQDWDAFSQSDGERLIAEMARRHPDEPGKWFQFAIVRSEDELLLGDCGFFSGLLRSNQGTLKVGGDSSNMPMGPLERPVPSFPSVE